jgi:hypothetical protein
VGLDDKGDEASAALYRNNRIHPTDYRSGMNTSAF